MNGDFPHGLRIVARSILSHIVQVVASLTIQTSDIQCDVLVGGSLNTARLQSTSAGSNSHLCCQLVQGRTLCSTHDGIRILVALGNQCPVNGAVLIEHRLQAHAGHLNRGDGRLCNKHRRCAVHSLKGELLNIGVQSAICVNQTQIEIIFHLFLEILTVHVEQVDDISRHVPNTRSQVAAERTRLEVLHRGSFAALGEHSIIQLAGLVGHNSNLAGGIGDLRHVGIPGCKLGHSVVRC